MNFVKYLLLVSTLLLTGLLTGCGSKGLSSSQLEALSTVAIDPVHVKGDAYFSLDARRDPSLLAKVAKTTTQGWLSWAVSSTEVAIDAYDQFTTQQEDGALASALDLAVPTASELAQQLTPAVESAVKSHTTLAERYEPASANKLFTEVNRYGFNRTERRGDINFYAFVIEAESYLLLNRKRIFDQKIVGKSLPRNLTDFYNNPELLNEAIEEAKKSLQVQLSNLLKSEI